MKNIASTIYILHSSRLVSNQNQSQDSIADVRLTFPLKNLVMFFENALPGDVLIFVAEEKIRLNLIKI